LSTDLNTFQAAMAGRYAADPDASDAADAADA
jgi:hypothetical protein